MAFLIAYAILTVLHALGGEPAFIARLVPIPLFARIVAATIAAGAGGALAPGCAADPARATAGLPAVLAGATALAILAILVCA